MPLDTGRMCIAKRPQRLRLCINNKRGQFEDAQLIGIVFSSSFEKWKKHFSFNVMPFQITNRIYAYIVYIFEISFLPTVALNLMSLDAKCIFLVLGVELSQHQHQVQSVSC